MSTTKFNTSAAFIAYLDALVRLDGFHIVSMEQSRGGGKLLSVTLRNEETTTQVEADYETLEVEETKYAPDPKRTKDGDEDPSNGALASEAINAEGDSIAELVSTLPAKRIVEMLIEALDFKAAMLEDELDEHIGQPHDSTEAGVPIREERRRIRRELRDYEINIEVLERAKRRMR